MPGVGSGGSPSLGFLSCIVGRRSQRQESSALTRALTEFPLIIRCCTLLPRSDGQPSLLQHTHFTDGSVGILLGRETCEPKGQEENSRFSNFLRALQSKLLKKKKKVPCPVQFVWLALAPLILLPHTQENLLFVFPRTFCSTWTGACLPAVICPRRLWALTSPAHAQV